MNSKKIIKIVIIIAIVSFFAFFLLHKNGLHDFLQGFKDGIEQK
jgi:hypothetical protein